MFACSARMSSSRMECSLRTSACRHATWTRMHATTHAGAAVRALRSTMSAVGSARLWSMMQSLQPQVAGSPARDQTQVRALQGSSQC